MVVPSLYVFVFLYILSFFLVISGDDWFMIWMGLEINMLSFIMFVFKRYSRNSVECCMKYFFVQSLGSAMLLGIFYLNSEVISNLLVMVLSYKIGAAPFYFWFPSMCSGLEWMSCFLLLSFQKIIPLMLMVMFVGWVIWIIMIMSLLLGVMGSFGQSNMKSLFAYSSVHHLGWIFLCNLFSDEIWMMYLLLYCIVVLGVLIILFEGEVIYFYMIDKWKSKLWFAFSMLSMAGMPPMLGFFLSWIAFIFVMKMNMMFVMFMIIMSVVMFYVYFRIVYDVFMYFNSKMCSMNYYNKISYFSVVDFVSIMGLLVGLGILVIFFL